MTEKTTSVSCVSAKRNGAKVLEMGLSMGALDLTSQSDGQTDRQQHAHQLGWGGVGGDGGMGAQSKLNWRRRCRTGCSLHST